MTSYHGSCFCGQVEWDVKLEGKNHVLCHCDTCKKLGGGAYSLNQIVPMKDLKITKGQVKDFTYHGASGKPVHCYHCGSKESPLPDRWRRGITDMANAPLHSWISCYKVQNPLRPNCTSHVYHHQEVLGDQIVVRTILLDEGKSFEPTAEIFGKYRLPWVKESAQTFDIMPPS
ncbi:hypothetical protein M430DRAFT_41776 [Amorphotheca resinae ATCC 22711]|uniref:CENP-V/GFA domain-containing protein n=1 Tax=Amorphotheca resinae ATCC 22711 TaxID=857342 RepID=A0A2T3B4B7_AMORE|nr:hypothetical protein M430DRAFT_41776 [Amorphotheca resinae ATCC 22711]PSS20468.1 hypothetical protein M430DRAFT_41776 [Amorphotheca resinae ATCC 22711]